MLLVDTSVWVDHLNGRDTSLADALDSGRVLIHPHVLGEIALGSLKTRSTVLALLANLPKAEVATDDEVLLMIDRNKLYSRGIGYTDAHLLAAVRLTEDALLWTRDKRLYEAARDLGMHAD